MNIDSIINDIIKREGTDYTNHPSDRGGPTKFGITLDTLSRYRNKPCVATDVENMTREEARNIYYYQYILKPGFDKVFNLSAPIGIEIIDTGVNCGVGVAAMILQRCLNAFNKQGTLYADVPVDGDCGPGTLRALRGFIDARGNNGLVVLYKALNSLQGERYVDLCEKRPPNEDFVFGWFAGRVGLTADA